MRVLIFANLLLLSASSIATADDTSSSDKPVKVMQRWSAELANRYRGTLPRTAYIADQTSWSNLWKVWQPKKKVPKVDFETRVVVVALGADPNRIGIEPSLSQDGKLRLRFSTTLALYGSPKSFRYAMIEISKEGIQDYGIKHVEMKPPASKANSVKAIETWSELVSKRLRGKLPTSGYINDNQTWSKLWTSWYPNRSIPKVDFDQNLGLLVVGDDTRLISVSPTIDKNGRLDVSNHFITVPDSDTGVFRFAMVMISQKGISDYGCEHVVLKPFSSRSPTK